jgi:hypothetical protein
MTEPDLSEFGFGRLKPKPSNQRALDIANAVIELVEAHQELNKARDSVPDYTAQWSNEDYYGSEQEAFYRAATKLQEVIDAT